MRAHVKHFRGQFLVLGAAVALTASPVHARRQAAAQTQDQTTQGQATNPGNPNPDLNRQQLAVMDQFLDSHPDIDRQLRANPALINDPGYLKANPQLQTFLNQHPGMAEEFRETPSYFMAREDRFDAREARRTNLTRREMEDRDKWLDKHKDIDRDLRMHPELVNDNDYLARHKDLRDFLAKEPNVRSDFSVRATPSANVNQTAPNRFDAREARRTNVTQKEIEDRDKWLDKHKDIDRDLRTNPELVNDNDYLARHKDLRDFLAKEPNVRSDFSARATASANVNQTAPNRLTPGDRRETDRFFDKHKDIAKDLRDHPDDVHNQKYLARHKDLREFLDKNPRVREEATENPSVLSASNRDRDAGKGAYSKHERSNKPSANKPTGDKTQDTQPPRTPTEQRGGVATPASPVH